MASWPSLRRDLEGAIEAFQPRAHIRLLSCDHDAHGNFEEWAGCRLAHPVILGTEPHPAILMVGLRDQAVLRRQFASQSTILDILDWPGFRYLQYGFDASALIAAAETALAGRSAPVPLPSPADLRDVLQPVAHWLQGLGGRLHQAQADFSAAAVGTAALHQTYLRPSDHYGEGPRLMVSRLASVLRACAFLDDRAGTEAVLLTFAETFAIDLQGLEKIKARLVRAPVHGSDELRSLAEAAAACLLDVVRFREHIAVMERRAAGQGARGS